MTDSNFSVNLQKGDLCVINYSTGLWPAIFKGIGKSKNPQFWLLIRDRLNWHIGGNKIYTDYIIRTAQGNIAKVNPLDADQKTQDLYRDYVNFLKSKNLL